MVNLKKACHERTHSTTLKVRPEFVEGQSRRVFIRTFGCQMNDRDSEIIYGMLIEKGYEPARSMNDADVILFNTCSVRKHAEDRVWGKVGMLKDIKKERFGLILGIVGCMAQNYKEKILKELPWVDFVCGPQNIYDIPELIEKARLMGRRCVAVDKGVRPIDGPQPSYRIDSLKTYVSISEGCSNYCFYCIVPYVRGREVSRPRDDIIKEVKDLVKRGFKEVTLLGQNVNSYGNDLADGVSFVRLLEDLDKTGIERIRFITSHPKDVTDDLFKAMRDFGSVCEHLHLPLQSGSDRILELMRRGYAREDFFKLVEKLRRYVPQSAITTDIIVGFPGETDDDFNQTVRLMKEVEFDNGFIFKYSPRPPAKSSELEDDVPKKVKEERNRFLLELQAEISLKKNNGLVGTEVEILVDGRSRKDAKRLSGRTRTDKVVVFEGDRSFIGKLAKVAIDQATTYTLMGECVYWIDGG